MDNLPNTIVNDVASGSIVDNETFRQLSRNLAGEILVKSVMRYQVASNSDMQFLK